MNIPNDVRDHMITWFSFPDKEVFGQVSTLSHMQSHVRTMKLYDINKKGNVIFLTSITTRKWKNLQSNPSIAVCLFQPDKGQILIEGTADLYTYSNNPETTQLYWQQLTVEWQQFYLSHDIKADNGSVPASFGVIEISPTVWEILEINSQDYLKSLRKQYQLVVDIWVCQELSPV